MWRFTADQRSSVFDSNTVRESLARRGIEPIIDVVRRAPQRVGSLGCTALRSPQELTVRFGISPDGTNVSAATASL